MSSNFRRPNRRQHFDQRLAVGRLNRQGKRISAGGNRHVLTGRQVKLAQVLVGEKRRDGAGGIDGEKIVEENNRDRP